MAVPWQSAFEGRVPTAAGPNSISNVVIFAPSDSEEGRVPGGGASADCRFLTVCAYVTFRGLLPAATTVQPINQSSLQVLPLKPSCGAHLPNSRNSRS